MISSWKTIPLDVVAERFGTPTYVYDDATLRSQVEKFQVAFERRPTRICFAVKANPSMGILSRFHQLGLSFDIVSGGELERLKALNVPGKHILFSGVGKTATEIREGLLYGIESFNCESVAEIERINGIASELGTIARVALRINPNVLTDNHPYIATGHKASKFGISEATYRQIIAQFSDYPHCKLIGLSCHIGSQILSTSPFIESAKKMNQYLFEAKQQGHSIQWVDLGGGLGVQYSQADIPPSIDEYASAICSTLSSEVSLIIEPGRSLIADAGILLSRIEYLKSDGDNHFCILDAGMNDLMRPSLYQAKHHIELLNPLGSTPEKLWTVVGPVCESSDCFAHSIPLRACQGDLVAIHNAGAYGSSMSSTYNSRPRPAEVLIKENQHILIRRREDRRDLFKDEMQVL